MKIVMYGAPVVGFVDRVKAGISVDAEFVSLAYDAPAEEKAAAFSGADILITNRYNEDNPSADSVKLIQLPGAGYDEVKLDLIPDGIPTCNVYEHDTGVAEFVMLAMLNCNWNIGRLESTIKAGSWELSSRYGAPPALELAGKTLGVVGFGRIGRAITQRAKAFGMNVVAANRDEPWLDEYRHMVDELYDMSALNEMLPHCDYVLVSCVYCEDTHDLFAEEQFALMKDTAAIFNISRGPVINEKALYTALKENQIGGAHIDVWYRYPDAEDPNQSPAHYPFETLSNAHMSPHVAGWTDGTIDRRWQLICDNINAICAGEEPKNRLK